MTRYEDDHDRFGLEGAVGAVQQRLLQMRKLWEKAAESYFSPEEFRLNLQGCITISRTVTFILQSNKSLIRNFDSWYAGYVEIWKSDQIMEWAKNSRNVIEKQGDLSMFSQFQAKIVASYVGGPVTDWTTLPLFYSNKAIRSSIPKKYLIPQVLQHGTLVVERRWVANSLPDNEILEAMAHVYNQLARITIDLTRQTGNPLPNWLSHGLPHSMHDLAMDRAAYVSIADGSTYGYRVFNKPLAEPTEFQKSTLEKRYGPITKFLAPRVGDSLRERAEHLFNVAKAMLVRDGYHVGIAFLISDKAVNIVEVEFPNRAAKYVLTRELAKYAAVIGAKNVIMIGEAWTASPEKVPVSGFASEAKGRGEALVLNAANDKGEHFNISAQFHRRLFSKEKIRRIDPPSFSVPEGHFMMFPFLLEWKALPEEDFLRAMEAEQAMHSKLHET